MKSLTSFIKEAQEESKVKSFVFDFTGLENGEETMKSLCGDDCPADGKFTLEVDANDPDAVEKELDILQQFAETIRRSTKNASNEQYAQLTKKFANVVKSVQDFLAADEEDKKEEE